MILQNVIGVQMFGDFCDGLLFDREPLKNFSYPLCLRRFDLVLPRGPLTFAARGSAWYWSRYKTEAMIADGLAIEYKHLLGRVKHHEQVV